MSSTIGRGVRSVTTVAGLAKLYVAGNNEANPRWAALQRSETALRTGGRAANPDLGLNTYGCKTINLLVYLKDHQGPTLAHVVKEVQHFIDAEHTPGVRFRLGGRAAPAAGAVLPHLAVAHHRHGRPAHKGPV